MTPDSSPMHRTKRDRWHHALLDLLLIGEGLSGILLLTWGVIVFIPGTDALAGSLRYTVLLDLAAWAPDPEVPIGLFAMFGGIAMSASMLSRDYGWRFNERWIGRVVCAVTWFLLAVPMLMSTPHVVSGWLAAICVIAHLAAARKERATTAELTHDRHAVHCPS